MSPRIRQSGMSMVELMVAMAIALIGTIIIFQVFEVSEGIRRTTTSGGDAQQNGQIGLYVIENDLRNAGMGFNDTQYAGCNATAYDSGRAPTNFSVLMAPASIAGGAANTAPDSLSIFYGSQYAVANATTITAVMTNGTSNVKVVPAGRYGFRTGDMLLLVEPATPPVKCELMQVTSLPGSDDIVHANTAFTLDWVTAGPVGTASRFNPAGGSAATFGGVGASATRVFNIGNPYDKAGVWNTNGPTTPVYNTYSIVNNTLMVQSLFTNAAAVPVADNIVHMRALYGLDDGVNNGTVTINPVYLAGDGLVDRYIDAATFDAIPAANKPWQYLIVVKVVIVARSINAERPEGGAVACNATTAPVTWSGTGLAGLQTSLDLSANPDWQCYRYRVFETSIPLRNWIWKSS